MESRELTSWLARCGLRIDQQVVKRHKGSLSVVVAVFFDRSPSHSSIFKSMRRRLMISIGGDDVDNASSS